MPVPFVALAEDYARVRDAVRERFERVLEGQVFVLGAETAELERRMRELCGVGHAIACSSGTDALVLALLASGIGAGDAVVVPAFTFFATASAVRRVGAVPVFADVDARTFNLGTLELSAVLEREFAADAGMYVHRASAARLRAVIAVHLFGRAADAHALSRVSADAHALLIEDAAQAIGAVTIGGPVGSRGAAGCFSFYPTKNIGAAGEGGLVTTGDGECAARLRRLRAHGADPGQALHRECGLNARMDELQAAYLNAKLERLGEWTAARRKAAARYLDRLASLSAAGKVVLPPPPPDARAHVWHQMVVRIERDRDGVRSRLAARGIEARVFYPVPLHLQPCFADLGQRTGTLPVCERLAREVLSLPIFASITESQVDEVCDGLADALGG